MKVKAVKIRLTDEGRPYLGEEETKITVDGRKKFDNGGKIFDLFQQMDLSHAGTEYLYMVMLDTACHLLCISELAHGNVSTCVFSNREIAMTALLAGAAHVILAHNHPSGDASPSDTDIVCTERIQKSLSFVGIDLSDHLVIGRAQGVAYYVSLLEDGYIRKEQKKYDRTAEK